MSSASFKSSWGQTDRDQSPRTSGEFGSGQASTGVRDLAARVPDRSLNLSLHSAWSQAAILRRDWSPGSAQLSLTYDHGSIRCELHHASQTLWSGHWEPEITLQGVRLGATSEWKEVCWVSDDDGDYLELQKSFAGGRIVQRQIYLAREDHFLFLADVVLGKGEDSVEYSSTMPLNPEVCFQPAHESREGSLCGRRRLAWVMPLALPEWRSQAAPGELHVSASGLELRQQSGRPRLFAPWFIDLEPRRLGKQRTWRKLTIAQCLSTQTDDVAAAYRVQVGSQQWLIYRSLGPRGNRTVLGQNFNTEFVLARFNRNGRAEKLIEVE